MLPYLINQVMKIEVLFTGYHYRVLLSCKSVDFFYRDLINLVIALFERNKVSIEDYQSNGHHGHFVTYINAGKVFSIAKNDINELVDSDIFTNQHISVK